MLAGGAGRLSRRPNFVQADLASWQPDRRPDLLFSNATFQWVPDHVAGARSGWPDSLKPGGVLAVQMPDNLDGAEPSPDAGGGGGGPWAAKLAKALRRRAICCRRLRLLRRAEAAASRSSTSGTRSTTTRSTGLPGIIDWLMSTGLRPYLDPLDAAETRSLSRGLRSRAGAGLSSNGRMARCCCASRGCSCVGRCAKRFEVFEQRVDIAVVAADGADEGRAHLLHQPDANWLACRATV